MEVFSVARKDWKDVDEARGKGRLAREKAKQVANSKID
jgi:queuine tRNA-ribosyltransferase